MSNSLLQTHYSSGGIPSEIAENLKDFFPEDGDLSYEEVLLQQETVYLSLQANGKNKNITSEYGQTSSGHQLSEQKSDSSQSLESQLALDEALARSLQLGDDFEDFCRDELNSIVAGIGESPPRESPPVRVQAENPNTRIQDDIDPDGMTYEELQSLGEAVGQQSRGLSQDLIRRLPTFKYKTGFFSKKKKMGECVICYAAYRSGDMLTTLPCAHMFHSECINRWLKERKNCPLCYEEVKDE
ncbi:E3 ubiquitin-protein ligase BIG BROTHER [Capsicum galapagoense]